jgi:hypothetical protein
MEVLVGRGVKWNKNDVLMYEENPVFIWKEKTLLQAYSLPPSAFAMTTTPVILQSVSKLSVLTGAIKLRNDYTVY